MLKLMVELDIVKIIINNKFLNQVDLKVLNTTLDGKYLFIDFIYNHKENNVEYYHDGEVSELSNLEYINMMNISGDFHFKAKFEPEYDYINMIDAIRVDHDDVKFIKLSNYNREFDKSLWNTVEDKRTLEKFIYNSFKNKIIELINNSEIEVAIRTNLC